MIFVVLLSIDAIASEEPSQGRLGFRSWRRQSSRDVGRWPFPGRRRHAAYGILLCEIQEFTTADPAVNVTIKYAQLLRKIGRFFSFHLK
jgi:hypothetical protein